MTPSKKPSSAGMLDPNKARSKDELVKLLKFELEQNGIKPNAIALTCASALIGWNAGYAAALVMLKKEGTK